MRPIDLIRTFTPAQCNELCQYFELRTIAELEHALIRVDEQITVKASGAPVVVDQPITVAAEIVRTGKASKKASSLVPFSPAKLDRQVLDIFSKGGAWKANNLRAQLGGEINAQHIRHSLARLVAAGKIQEIESKNKKVRIKVYVRAEEKNAES